MAVKTAVKATNEAIINKVRANASLGYQERIPVVTRANLARTFEQLHNYEPMWNEFISVLINRIGLTLFNTNSFTNKLRPLKSGAMNYGGVMQEMGANLLKGEAYDPNATNVFDAPKPDVEVNYHVKNRRDMYPMRLNEDLLSEAFLNDGQLQAFINAMLALPQQSDEWDEYLIMRGLLKKYNDIDGFANYQVPDLATSTDPEGDGKKITEMVRQVYLQTKDFYNKAYNAAGMDVTSSELILLGTPKFFARLDVNVLASAYHMDKADFFADRTIIVDDFEIPGAQCMLLDQDFYKVTDTKLKTTTIYNPRADEWVYYLHHQGVYSASRMRNAIMFSTAADNIQIGTPAKVSSVAAALATPVTDNKVLEPGAQIPLAATVTYSDNTTDNAAFWVLTASGETAPDGTTTTKPNVILPDTGTFVDRMGVLHIAEGATYTSLTATAYAAADPTKLANLVLAPVDAAASANEEVK
jgi:hypothetical protein